MVKISFTDFDLEGGSGPNGMCMPTDDAVDITDVFAWSMTDPTYCGSGLPPDFTTTEADALVTFRSDSSTTKKGFSAIVTFVDAK